MNLIIIQTIKKLLTLSLTFVFALVCFQGSTKAQQLLYTVTNQNELAAIDVVTHSATIIGVTQDTSFGPTRRIRGLAYDATSSTMYGLTREGDLVTVNRFTGQTILLYSIPNPPPNFWSGLAFDGIGINKTLYATNAFGTHNLFKIVLGNPTTVNSGSVVGPTDFGTVALQILGLDFYPSSAPLMPPPHPALGVLYGSNRNNDNIVVVNQTNGAVTFPFGNQTVGVPNLQEIAFHPVTGELYAIHDHFSQSNNAALSVYNFTTQMATQWGELPFGIVQTGGIGKDTYGWGGLTFAPSLCVPPPNNTMVAWYPFDEPWTVGSLPNTAADFALGNDGTYFPGSPNGPTPIAGKVGNALNFDGIDDYVQSPLAPNFGAAGPVGCSNPCKGDFSIDAWIRLQPSLSNPVSTIVDKRDNTTTERGYHFFVFNNNQLGLRIADTVLTTTVGTNYFSPPYSTPPLVLTDGQWHHVAVTVRRRTSSTDMRPTISFYNNGVMSTSPLMLPNKLGTLSNNTPLRIGTRTTLNPLSAWFRGDIDELEIFNRELSSVEVSQIFQADYFGKCKP